VSLFLEDAASIGFPGQHTLLCLRVLAKGASLLLKLTMPFLQHLPSSSAVLQRASQGSTLDRDALESADPQDSPLGESASILSTSKESLCVNLLSTVWLWLECPPSPPCNLTVVLEGKAFGT
jgi:hypothetical protein